MKNRIFRLFGVKSFSGTMSNIWKMFLFNITHGSYYHALLGVIFLSFPGNQIKEIGFYTGAAYLASLILELPTGYISDRFGHKNSLILSKFLKAASTLCFIAGNNVWRYTAGAVLGSLGFAFASGTKEAFVHETLMEHKLDDKYGSIMSKSNGMVAIVSAILIAAIPFLLPFGSKLPFIFWIPFDVAGIFLAFILVNPQHKHVETKKKKPLWEVMKGLKGSNFYVIAIFSALVRSMFRSGLTFHNVYLEYIGFPVILLGVMKGLGRILWFVFSRFVDWFEQTFTLKQMFLIELLFFPILLLLMGLFPNPYIVALLGILGIGYMHGRRDIVDKHLLDRVVDRRYKATLMSFTSQLTSIFMLVATFGLGFAMDASYKLGWILLAGTMFVGLGISLLYFWRKQ